MNTHAYTLAKRRAASLIENNNINLKALAAEVGCSYSVLWNYIKGKTVSFSYLPQLAKALGKPLSYFIDENANNDHDAIFRAEKATKAIVDLLLEIKALDAPNKLKEHLRQLATISILDLTQQGKDIDLEQQKRFFDEWIKFFHQQNSSQNG